jgi:hypothetical protein
MTPIRLRDPDPAALPSRLRVGLMGEFMGATSMAIAFFSTWTTYGTWLPGDQRG